MYTLAQRLRIYLRLFAARDDLHVWVHTWETPTQPGEPLPDEPAAFLRDHALRFAWSFEPPYATLPSGDGGRLLLHPGHGEGWLTAQERWLEGMDASLLIDACVEEGLTFLAIPEGASTQDATPVFYNANDETLRPFDSLEDYLTQGARRAFTWYWQADPPDESDALLQRLDAASLPARSGDQALLDGLQRQGASSEEAAALLAWLGDDARRLIPAA